MMKPTKNAELAPLIAKLLPESIKKNMNIGAKAAPMSGICVIYEEFFSMPGTYWTVISLGQGIISSELEQWIWEMMSAVV